MRPLSNYPLPGDNLTINGKVYHVLSVIKGTTASAQVARKNKTKWVPIHDGKSFNKNIFSQWHATEDATEDANATGRMNNNVWETRDAN